LWHGGDVFVFSIHLWNTASCYQFVIRKFSVYVENVCGVGYNGISWKLETLTQLKGTQMAKPSVKLVQEWEVAYESGLVKVSYGTAVFEQDYWKVENRIINKVQYFYGETAWSDARRRASDIDFGAWSF